MIQTRNNRCPHCNGLLKWSKIEDDKFICKTCNSIILQSEVDNKMKTYEELFGKRRMK